MTKWAGKNGAEGNWVNNFRIPFYKNVRVTAQIDPSRPAEILPNATIGIFAIFRGVEGDENTLAATVQLGGIPLPPLKQFDVRLRLLKNVVRKALQLPLRKAILLVALSVFLCPSCSPQALFFLPSFSCGGCFILWSRSMPCHPGGCVHPRAPAPTHTRYEPRTEQGRVGIASICRGVRGAWGSFFCVFLT